MDPLLQKLVTLYGFRVSNADARRAGVSERVLVSAVVAGRAKVERAHLQTEIPTVVYLVFA